MQRYEELARGIQLAPTRKSRLRGFQSKPTYHGGDKRTKEKFSTHANVPKKLAIGIVDPMVLGTVMKGA